MKIKIKDTTNLLKNYLVDMSLVDLKTIAYDDKESLFDKILNDYKIGEISLDELSSLSETIWWTLSKKEKTNPFGTVLMSGMELGFYERQAVKADSGKIFIDFLRDVLSYKQ